MKSVFFSLAGLALLVALLGGASAQAQGPTVMTDDHMNRIKTNCQPTLAILQQIRANDGPVFVNRNQAYFSISDKLIARLNSRLALSRYNTTNFAKIANEYNEALSQFRTANKVYSESMGDLIKINCLRQPVGFYDKVAEVRQHRTEVKEAIQRLHALIEQYKQEVSTFKADNFSKQKEAGTNE